MLMAMPKDYSVVSRQMAQTWCERVIDLRRHWYKMDPDCECYSLGAASYLARSGDAYREAAGELNGLLRREFEGLYEAVFETLEAILRAHQDGPLVVEQGYALPGFQIMLVDDKLRDPLGKFGGPHWDWNFLYLDWDPALPEELDLTRFASFTLPLALPRAGSGLLVWESLTSSTVDDYAAGNGLRQWEAAELLTRPPSSSSYHPYSVGTLVVHSGHLVHRIPDWELAEGDQRVTMQGHALFNGGKWQLYW